LLGMGLTEFSMQTSQLLVVKQEILRAHLKALEKPTAEPLQRFANKLAAYWRGILSRVRWPMHTGQLEGINNRIKVMKRMAYGYRDSAYFFLKIKAAYPGNP
ncbi:transposase, partial [Burkholderia ubonensis]|uniref:transposase n=1 Tax=Burkholderia ubonensis TaxID=101571 RepID=UPI000A9116B2